MDKKKKVILKKRRIFNESFKRARVKEYETGQLTVLEISRLYGINLQTVYLWIYKYSVYNKKSLKIVEEKDSSTRRVKQLQERVKELEQIIGKKQIRIDYLEKMIEIAKEELGIDIKKNYDTPRSPGSGKIKD
jgi:transposase-like protein